MQLKELKHELIPYKSTWPYNSINYIKLKKQNNKQHIRVAIIDTGIDMSQKCFNGFKINYHDIYNNNQNIEDNIHGTMVTGIICTSRIISDSTLKDYLTLDVIRIGSDKSININSLIDGIKKAIELEDNIINISLGTYKNNIELNKVIQEAIKKDIIIICSSGDDSTRQYLFPASYDGVISVMSTDANNIPLLNNNINDKITICAPGENIPTGIFIDPNKELLANGSSSSAALVTSTVIMLKSIDSKLDSEKIRKIMNNTSTIIDGRLQDAPIPLKTLNYNKAALNTKNPFLYYLYNIIYE